MTFFSFSLKTSFALKGTRVKSVPKVKKKMMEVLKQFMGEDLLHRFNQWKTGKQWCRDALKVFVIEMKLKHQSGKSIAILFTQEYQSFEQLRMYS